MLRRQQNDVLIYLGIPHDDFFDHVHAHHMAHHHFNSIHHPHFYQQPVTYVHTPFTHNPIVAQPSKNPQFYYIIQFLLIIEIKCQMAYSNLQLLPILPTLSLSEGDLLKTTCRFQVFLDYIHRILIKNHVLQIIFH